MRALSCQAETPKRKADWKQEAKHSGKTAGYLAGLLQKRKRKKQEKQRLLLDNERQVRAKASPPKPTPGGIAKAVRQTGVPSGSPGSRTPETGKNGPSGQGLPISGAVGAGSDASAHYRLRGRMARHIGRSQSCQPPSSFRYCNNLAGVMRVTLRINRFLPKLARDPVGADLPASTSCRGRNVQTFRSSAFLYCGFKQPIVEDAHRALF